MGIIIKSFGSRTLFGTDIFFGSFSHIGLKLGGTILRFFVHELVYYLPIQKQGWYEHLEIFSMRSMVPWYRYPT